jgi:Tfp pilus assembly protein PilV
MKRNGDEVEVSHARRARRDTRPGDDGIGILEILIAFVVFMICFVPLLQLFPEGARVIATSASTRLAANVANSTLQNYQSSVTPPSFAATHNVPPTWASAPRTATSQGGQTFQIYTIGGWCRSSTAPGNGTVLATDQPSYHLVVKVGWGKGLTNSSVTNVVVDSTELPTVTGAPTAGTAVLECPLGLA